MPRKIRELIEDLKRAGFIDRGGKGSHRNFIHPNLLKPITISGKLGDDVLLYQEKSIKQAIKEAQL
jgi:predicted RNA binding protein YcfA (HicA-like mRNA interferase family)